MKVIFTRNVLTTYGVGINLWFTADFTGYPAIKYYHF